MLRRVLDKLLPRGRKTGPSKDKAEELRADFKARYHHFKLLLSANSEALEVMSEMEEALRGVRPFGMHFIRASTTRVSSSVFNMVRHLRELAGTDAYDGLLQSFHDIQDELTQLVAAGAQDQNGPLIVFMEDLDKSAADLAGPKMASLGEAAQKLGLRVPDAFVVTAHAQRLFLDQDGLQAEIDRMIQSRSPASPEHLQTLSSAVQQMIVQAELPQEVADALRRGRRTLEERAGGTIRLAMRSSALGEDVQGASFAGQYRSVLNVSPESMIEAYKEVVASKYSPQAMTYRLRRGIPDEQTAMCVGCMVMVDAQAGGVAYSRDPMDIRADAVKVVSVFGLPRGVVEGTEPTDVFTVAREKQVVTGRDVAHKPARFVCREGEGCDMLELETNRQDAPSLSDEQILEVAGLAAELERYFSTPQDMEWAIAPDGGVVVLQCRPLAPARESSREKRAIEGAVLSGGTTASPGVAAGPVHVVTKDAHTLAFPDGAILVVDQPFPRRAALLGRAAAVVAETGSPAGHLANVAREFGVPAVFGLAGAVEALAQDEEYTVDADQGAVFPGRVEELLEGATAPRNLMEGSPVLDTLQKVAGLVTPLNLVDPDSIDFRPRECRTLHDITRFCHEKSVHEMFRFGQAHDFPERQARRLVCHRPMQFWIIDLDDGLKGRPEPGEVRLSQIASEPMLALWKGMVAVPWGGPPPMDSRGFLSVLFEATVNPDLDPSSGSKYSVRNYFLISRTFCSLQSRFGFHFCGVETLVGERTPENYAVFRFRGGAAGLARRIRRARFIAELLEDYGFTVRLRQDALTARVEGLVEEEMLTRLTMLGHLIIHTRQVDMVMADDAAVTKHKDKLREQIEEVLAQSDPSC